MRSGHARLKYALLAALVLEAINFWIIGYPSASHPITGASQNAAVALQWDVLHLPGIIATDRSISLRHHPWINYAVLFIAGFVDTAIVVLLVFWLIGVALRALRKLSSSMNQAASPSRH